MPTSIGCTNTSRRSRTASFAAGIPTASRRAVGGDQQTLDLRRAAEGFVQQFCDLRVDFPKQGAEGTSKGVGSRFYLMEPAKGLGKRLLIL